MAKGLRGSSASCAHLAVDRRSRSVIPADARHAGDSHLRHVCFVGSPDSCCSMFPTPTSASVSVSISAAQYPRNHSMLHTWSEHPPGLPATRLEASSLPQCPLHWWDSWQSCRWFPVRQTQACGVRIWFLSTAPVHGLCPPLRPLFTGFKTFSILVKALALCSFPSACVLYTGSQYGTCGLPLSGDELCITWEFLRITPQSKGVSQMIRILATLVGCRGVILGSHDSAWNVSCDSVHR